MLRHLIKPKHLDVRRYLLPMVSLRTQLGGLLAADATTLAPAANANVIGLFVNNINPTENDVIGSYTPASFTSYADIQCALGTQLTGVDPVTGAQIITLKTPLGGWRWSPTDAVGLPQTIYGFFFATKSRAALLGAQRLATPITLTAAGQIIDLGEINLTFVQKPLS